MTTKAQIKAQWIAAMPTFTFERLDSLAASQERSIADSEARLVELAFYPPLLKRETAAIAFNKSILRAIRAEQKARQAAKVAA